jgi:general secretion pathway protein F
VLLDYNVQLPLPTRILIGLTHVITYYGIFILIAFIAAAVGIRKLLERPDWKFRWDTMMLSIPYARGIIKDLNLARFARAMTSLLKSGVSIDRAMELSANTTGNSHYSKAIRGGVPFVRKGAPFAEVLKGHPKLYPPVASRMVEVGEHTGKLDHMLEKIAIFYEKSVTAKLDNLAGVLEPVLLIVVGSAVGFVALSVLMPIWKFSETI